MQALPRPEGVELIVAGVDVQAAYLATLVCGFSQARELWLLDYFTTPGDVRDGATLPSHIADLQAAGVQLIGVDSGYATDAVYAGTRGRRGVVATKGEQGSAEGTVVLPTPHDARKGVYRGARILRINTTAAKDELAAMLNNPARTGRNVVHIPRRLAHIVEQLTSEEKTPRFDAAGFELPAVWRKKTSTVRNEALDAAVMCIALFHSMGPVAWAALRQGPNNTAPRSTPAAPRSNRRW